MSMVDVHGAVAAGFGPVADAFRANFEDRGDTGAACAVYVEGMPVVDIWAGRTVRGPWRPDTRSCLFSVGKGVTTICLLMAAERGAIDLDATVASYWPEFAAAGKDRTTVRQVLAHQAGLVAPDADLSVDDVRAWDPVVDALAGQAPAWVPGTAFAYHALTVGWLAGEVLRRATGQRPGKWLAEHVAGPLGLTMTYGAEVDDPLFCPQEDQLPSTDSVAAPAPEDDPLVVRAFTLGGGGLDAADVFGSANRPDFLGSEVPAANLVSNARSCARLYASTVGEVDGVRLLGSDAVRDARSVLSQGPPFVGVDEGHRWGTGFMLSSGRRPMLGDGSFGHDGAGGQLAFGHLEASVGFGYQTVRPGGAPDDRADELCRALRACL